MVSSKTGLLPPRRTTSRARKGVRVMCFFLAQHPYRHAMDGPPSAPSDAMYRARSPPQDRELHVILLGRVTQHDHLLGDIQTTSFRVVHELQYPKGLCGSCLSSSGEDSLAEIAATVWCQGAAFLSGTLVSKGNEHGVDLLLPTSLSETKLMQFKLEEQDCQVYIKHRCSNCPTARFTNEHVVWHKR